MSIAEAARSAAIEDGVEPPVECLKDNTSDDADRVKRVKNSPSGETTNTQKIVDVDIDLEISTKGLNSSVTTTMSTSSSDGNKPITSTLDNHPKIACAENASASPSSSSSSTTQTGQNGKPSNRLLSTVTTSSSSTSAKVVSLSNPRTAASASTNNPNTATSSIAIGVTTTNNTSTGTSTTTNTNTTAASKRKGPLLRRGKWTTEEEAYANRLIQEFKAGLLPLTDGTTLRTFLSKLLNCDPMRYVIYL